MDIIETIKDQIENNRVILYMKGSPNQPQCGFSANASAVLGSYGVDIGHVDVLSDPELRQGIKDYSNWPTIPQIYVGGEFLGGAVSGGERAWQRPCGWCIRRGCCQTEGTVRTSKWPTERF